MSHTPGPWGLMAGRGNGPNGATIICRGLVIARTSRDADSPIDQKWSNARLIAAAPDLLEACKYMHQLLADMGHGGLAGPILGEMAIQKAEGLLTQGTPQKDTVGLRIPEATK